MYFKGYKLKNDRGHILVYDSANRFVGSCDSDEVNRMMDEIEAEEED